MVSLMRTAGQQVSRVKLGTGHWLLPLSTAPSSPVFRHIAHELGLQFLRTPFPANMQCSLAQRQLLVPGRQMDHWNLIVLKRGPHHPPAVTNSFQHAAIRARATVKRIGSKRKSIGHREPLYPRIVSEQYLLVTSRLGRPRFRCWPQPKPICPTAGAMVASLIPAWGGFQVKMRYGRNRRGLVKVQRIVRPIQSRQADPVRCQQRLPRRRQIAYVRPSAVCREYL